jgi:ABC-type multidrug transport system fused ATPase/permease subunit
MLQHMIGSVDHSTSMLWQARQAAKQLPQQLSIIDLCFPTCPFCTAGALLQGLNDDSAAVQAAISEKVAHFVQHMTTATAGIIVAFVGGWDMTLVMIGVLPFLAAVGMTLAKVRCLQSTCCHDQVPTCVWL